MKSTHYGNKRYGNYAGISLSARLLQILFATISRRGWTPRRKHGCKIQREPQCYYRGSDESKSIINNALTRAWYVEHRFPVVSWPKRKRKVLRVRELYARNHVRICLITEYEESTMRVH